MTLLLYTIWAEHPGTFLQKFYVITIHAIQNHPWSSVNDSLL